MVSRLLMLGALILMVIGTLTNDDVQVTTAWLMLIVGWLIRISDLLEELLKQGKR